MNEQNTKRIIEACPSLFSTMDENTGTILPINFGFECGDGWADLLVELCQNIQKCLDAFPRDRVEDVVALQVKEKYGTLRFYLSCYDETIELYIKDAEKKSACTCEQCGEPGKMRGKIWLYTACDEHTRPEDLNSASESELP